MAIAVSAVVTLGTTGRLLLDPDRAAPSNGTISTVGSFVTTGDAWTERLSDPAAWRGGRYIGDKLPRRPVRADEYPVYDADREHENGRDRERTGFNPHGSYRTVCVRLCDGYFFPISFATTSEHFARDEAACRSSCRTGARLFVYPNPGGEPEQMVSLDGRPYSALPAAFLFRTKYDAACTCKPHPWEQEALARHRAFAEGKQQNGNARTVARTVRTDPRHADATMPDGRSQPGQTRPEGAMLLGAERPDARAVKKAEPPRNAGNQRSGNYGRRSDWQSRAFGGF